MQGRGEGASSCCHRWGEEGGEGQDQGVARRLQRIPEETSQEPTGGRKYVFALRAEPGRIPYLRQPADIGVPGKNIKVCSG